jgi:NADH dehydrogenase
VDTLQRDDLLRQTVAIGGPEHFTLEQMVTQMLQVARVQKRLVRINAPLARIALWLLQVLLPGSPAPRRWLDVVAVGSATDLTSIPRHFGFEPARFADRLDYLRDDRSWRQNLARLVRRRR